MLNNWKTYKLGDIAKRITSGGTPSTKKTEYYNGTIPWLRTQEVTFNRIYDTDIKITEDAVKNSSAKLIDVNSIIVAMYGATAGRIAINKIPLTTNQACCNITINKHIADYNFIYYLLQSKFLELFNMATGAAQQNLNAGMLRELEITIPDLATQTQIAQILSSLDDKIELNLQMNQTLEAMAQALFKEWFVDFNFPDFDGELENGLPKGWRMGKLGEVLQPKKGKNITKSEAIEGTFPVVAGGLEPSCYHNKSNTKEPVITISSSGANAGFVRLYYSQVWSSDSCFIDNSIYQFVYYCYIFLKLNQKNIYDSQEGSAQPHIYPRHIMDLNICIGNELIVQYFEQIVTPIFEKIKYNSLQIQTLTQTRDALLPKLMSGTVLR